MTAVRKFTALPSEPVVGLSERGVAYFGQGAAIDALGHQVIILAPDLAALTQICKALSLNFVMDRNAVYPLAVISERIVMREGGNDF